MSSGRLLEVKNKRKFQTLSSKSARGCLREAITFKKFQMQWFRNFWYFGNWSLTESWSQTAEVRLLMKKLSCILFACLSNVIFQLPLRKNIHKCKWENSTSFEGFITVFTGYGNIVPRTANGRLFCIFYALVGIPLTCLTLKTIGEKLLDVITSLIQTIKKKNDRSNEESVRKGIVLGINVFLWFITLLLLSVLARWRRGWTMLESFYFCFITFSTIGFGDYVAFDENEANTFTDYFIVFLGVVLGFAATSTVLFSFSSLMEDRSHQTRLLQSFREFKKRLNTSKRITVAEALNSREKKEGEELTKNEATAIKKTRCNRWYSIMRHCLALGIRHRAPLQHSDRVVEDEKLNKVCKDRQTIQKLEFLDRSGIIACK